VSERRDSEISSRGILESRIAIYRPRNALRQKFLNCYCSELHETLDGLDLCGDLGFVQQ